MRALREFVENSETCISLAKEVSEIPLIQGVHVEPHPWLLRFWVAARNGKYPRDDNSYRFDDIDIFDPTVDPEFDFHDFGPRLKDFSERLPLLVRIHCAPERVSGEVDDMRNRVGGIANRFSDRVTVVVEDRARCVAAIAPGDEVSGDGPGTFGGTFSDGTDVYGMTCAHVVGAATSAMDAGGVLVGGVAQSSPLTPLPSGTLCQPGSQNGNDMDAALIRLGPSHIPPVQGLQVSQSYGSGQRVDMAGAKSGGPHSYRFGSLGLTQLVDVVDPVTGQSQPHCFQNLSSIRSTSLWGGRWSPIGHRARRGDSGAFILNVTGTLWYGMLTAVDGTEGFFLDASDVLSWAQGHSGLSNLQVR